MGFDFERDHVTVECLDYQVDLGPVAGAPVTDMINVVVPGSRPIKGRDMCPIVAVTFSVRALTF